MNQPILFLSIQLLVVGYLFDLSLRLFSRWRRERSWLLSADPTRRSGLLGRVFGSGYLRGVYMGQGYIGAPKGWSRTEWVAYQRLKALEGSLSKRKEFYARFLVR